MDSEKELLKQEVIAYLQRSELMLAERDRITEHIESLVALARLGYKIESGELRGAMQNFRELKNQFINQLNINRDDFERLIRFINFGIRGLPNSDIDEAAQRVVQKIESEVENMACLNCYACEIGEPHLPKTLGILKEPIGGCINCQAFACGHHGFRDRASCRFECIMCYPSLLASSAGAVAAVGNKDLNKQVLYELIIQHYPRRLPQEDLEFPYVYSTEEFYERYPFYKEQLQEKLATTEINWNLIETERVRNALKSFPDNAQEMLHAAGLLVKDKETKNYYPAILIQISAAIIPRNEGGNSYVLY